MTGYDKGHRFPLGSLALGGHHRCRCRRVDDLPAMLTPAQLARVLQVNAKTIARWSREGKLDAVFTSGGHRRFPLATVLEFFHEMGLDEQAANAAIESAVRPVRSIFAALDENRA